jgi:hypothetical protein
MRAAFYDNLLYRSKQSDITKENWRKGRFDSLRKPLETKLCKNLDCHKPFYDKSKSSKIYCSHSCSAHVNNVLRTRHRFCINCRKQTKSFKYCSRGCQTSYGYNKYIALWKKGAEDGNRGINTKILSKHIKRFLQIKFGEKCSKCGWKTRHPITNRIPLEVNHIDGNSENNKEDNLELICPNCHSLTPNFRNLNKGNGRKWRLEKINKNLVPSP